MQSLKDIILSHVEKKELGHLRKMSEEMAQVIMHVSKRANAVLLKDCTKEQRAHKYTAMANLLQAEDNYRLLITSIIKLEKGEDGQSNLILK